MKSILRGYMYQMKFEYLIQFTKVGTDFFRQRQLLFYVQLQVYLMRHCHEENSFN